MPTPAGLTELQPLEQPATDGDRKQEDADAIQAREAVPIQRVDRKTDDVGLQIVAGGPAEKADQRQQDVAAMWLQVGKEPPNDLRVDDLPKLFVIPAVKAAAEAPTAAGSGID